MAVQAAAQDARATQTFWLPFAISLLGGLAGGLAPLALGVDAPLVANASPLLGLVVGIAVASRVAIPAAGGQAWRTAVLIACLVIGLGVALAWLSLASLILAFGISCGSECTYPGNPLTNLLFVLGPLILWVVALVATFRGWRPPLWASCAVLVWVGYVAMSRAVLFLLAP